MSSRHPLIPLEVIREILAWALKPYIPHPSSYESTGKVEFTIECPPIVYPDINDVKNIAATAAAFRSIVKELCCVRIAIRSRQENQQYLSFFTERGLNDSTILPGQRTTSMDFRVPHDFDAELLAQALRYTPNLATFVLSTSTDQRFVNLLPEAVIQALSTSVPYLKHVYFDTVSNSPSVDQVILLLKSLKTIHTLHLKNICSYPDVDKFMKTPHRAPWATNLDTLSLGCLTPNQFDAHPIWDKLMVMLTHRDISMPRLQELVIPRFFSDPTFIKKYGPQIKAIHTTTFFSQRVLAPALAHLSSIKVIYLDLCDEIPHFPARISSLEELHILPCIEGYCSSGIHACPIRLHELLEEIQATECPSLKAVVVHVIGAFRHLKTRRAFMQKWTKRWADQGVGFMDGDGLSLVQN